MNQNHKITKSESSVYSDDSLDFYKLVHEEEAKILASIRTDRRGIPAPRSQILSSMASTMMKIPTFTGEDSENENPSRFLRQVDYAFAPTAVQYTSAGLRVDTAKYFFLQGSTSHTALKWLEDQSDELMENWEDLCGAFIKRFPMAPKTSSLPDALAKFYALKQSDRTLKEYFEEARYIQKHLPKELHDQLAEKTIQGLDDEMVRRVTGGILKKDRRDLDDVLDTIQSVSGESSSNDTIVRSKNQGSKDPYEGMAVKDRMFAQMMEETVKTMQSMRISNQQGARPAAYRNSTAPQSFNNDSRNSTNGQNNRPASSQAFQRPQAQGNQTQQPPNPGYPTRQPNNFRPGNANMNGTQSDFKVRCFRCGREGHTVRECENEQIPYQERQKVRNEFATRQAERNAQLLSQASGANTTPLGPGPVSVAAHQAEAVREGNGSFSRGHVMEGNVPDEWDLGDEDTQFKESYACEHCEEGADEWNIEDEVYMAAKRTAVEMESGDEGAEGPQRPPTKARKLVPTVTEKEPRNEQGEEATQVPLRATKLAPSLKKPEKAKPAPKRGAPPILRPRGMGDQDPWSAADWIQNAKIEITVAQLMQIAPKARTSVVDAIRLETNPNRKNAQTKKVAAQAEIYQVEFDESVADEQEGYEVSPVIPMDNKSLRIGKLRDPNSAASQRNMNSAANQRKGKGNFYTTALIQPRKGTANEFNVNRVLIDPGATLT